MPGATKGNIYSDKELAGWQHIHQWPTYKDAHKAHRHRPVTAGAQSHHGYDHRGQLEASANPMTAMTEAVKTYLGSHVLELGSIVNLGWTLSPGVWRQLLYGRVPP